MKCPNCGKEIANDSKFCEFCGTKIQYATSLPDSGRDAYKFGIIITISILIVIGMVGVIIWHHHHVCELSKTYHKNCLICNYKLTQANDYSYIDNFFEGIMYLRKIEETEQDYFFPDTIKIGSDTLFKKLCGRLTESSASLQRKMEEEPEKSAGNVRWIKFSKNKEKLDFWVEQLVNVRCASDFTLPQRQVKNIENK